MGSGPVYLPRLGFGAVRSAARAAVVTLGIVQANGVSIVLAPLLMLALPFIGALGAWLSLRAGGNTRDRAVPGHWEGDLLEGARGTFIATLVERQSRYVMLVRLPSKETHTVTRAIARRIRRLPGGLMKSLTIATNVNVYFCDPRSPWQRGSNENTNGLLRQYLPSATNLLRKSQAQLDAIALRLNTRPRLTLGYHTPAAKLSEIVAATG